MRTWRKAYYTDTSMVRITRWEPAGDGGYWLSFKCCDASRFQATIAALKTLPALQRRWVPDAPGGKCWWLAATAVPGLHYYAPGLAQALDAFTRYEGSYQHRPSTSALLPAETEQAFTVLYLRGDAPPQVVRAVYRALAPLLHPDHGGDEAAMVRLNNAHERALTWAEQHSAQ